MTKKCKGWRKNKKTWRKITKRKQPKTKLENIVQGKMQTTKNVLEKEDSTYRGNKK